MRDMKVNVQDVPADTSFRSYHCVWVLAILPVFPCKEDGEAQEHAEEELGMHPGNGYVVFDHTEIGNSVFRVRDLDGVEVHFQALPLELYEDFDVKAHAEVGKFADDGERLFNRIDAEPAHGIGNVEGECLDECPEVRYLAPVFAALGDGGIVLRESRDEVAGVLFRRLDEKL